MNTIKITAGGSGEPPATSFPADWREATLPTGKSGEIVGGTVRRGTNPAGNLAFQWMHHEVLTDRAQAATNPPENVLYYGQAYRYGNAPIWGQCIEVRNAGGDESRPIHVVEWDACSDGSDPNGHFIGGAIYYGAQSNTFNDGPGTVWDTGFRIHPFRYGRNAIRRGFSVEGKVEIGALVVGEHGQSEIRHAVNMGPGVTLKFSSGTGKAFPSAWRSFSRAYRMDELKVVGAVAFEVDGTTLWWPCLAEPPE